MIPFDFIYFRPDSLKEAADVFSELHSKGKNAVYYGGGSETITMCRSGNIHPDAVIDIKNIPECNCLSADEQNLHIGSVCTLNQISESKLYPLLRLTCGRIADHTNQCRITLGGNLCSTILYRETSLPLLLADAEITLYGPNGACTLPFENVFIQQMQKGLGEMILQVHVPIWALSARHAHIKKTTNEKIDYPLISLAALWKEDFLRIAFSGVCSFPFRSKQIEAFLNDRAKSCAERAEAAATLLPEPIYGDAKGSGEYRQFVLKNTLQKLLEDWENGKI